MTAAGRILGAAVIGLAFSSSTGCRQRRPGGNSAPPAAASSDSASGGADSAAARQFVESFYKWYAPLANAESRSPAWWRVLTSRPGSLDDDLARALRADSAAQRVVVPTREVINFDPFLDSQDPCPRYDALQARREKAVYLVTVRPVCADSTWQTQRPVIAVFRAASAWKIVNIFYQKGDLMGLLCQYAQADKRPQPRPPGC